MIDKSNIAEIYERYAPNNITLQEFTEMVERDPGLLDSIVGQFSTFNPELAKIYKGRRKPGGLSDDDFRIKLKESMSKNTMDTVAQKYADIYAQIICSDDDIVLAAWTFGTLTRKQRQELALKIVQGMNNYFGIDEETDVRYIDKKTQRPIGDMLLEHFSSVVLKIVNLFTKSNYKRVNWGGYYRNSRIVIYNSKDFLRFIGVISHEYGHFIDYRYPDLGMLGAQLIEYAEKVYSSINGDEIYHANPTEISSFHIEDIVMDKLTKVLVDQAIKKPALYAKALKILIDYTETQLAGLQVKYKKLFAAMDSAYQEYQDLKEHYCLEQNSNYEQLPHDQITQIIINANQNPKVKELYEKYKQARAKIPHEYAALKMDLEHYDRLLKAYNDSPQRFQQVFSVMSM